MTCAVLQTSALLYLVLKWIGAFYLIWLGIGLWRAGLYGFAAVAIVAIWAAVVAFLIWRFL